MTTEEEEEPEFLVSFTIKESFRNLIMFYRWSFEMTHTDEEFEDFILNGNFMDPEIPEEIREAAKEALKKCGTRQELLKRLRETEGPISRSFLVAVKDAKKIKRTQPIPKFREFKRLIRSKREK